MTARHAALWALVMVLVAGFAAACRGGNEQVEAPARDTTATTAPASSATTIAPTVAPGTRTLTLNVYFLRGGKLATAHRRIAHTQAVGRAAMEQLLAGPTDADRLAGFTSAVPTGTRLLGLSITNRVATVDLSREFVSGGQARSMRERLGQVVFTLTQFPTVERVSFRIEGSPTTTFGGEVTIPAESSRDEFGDVTPFILVESVAPGDVITSPVEISGLNNTFESTVRFRIVGADGRTLADTFTTGSGGMGTWGPFEAKVTFEAGSNTDGTVVVFEDSPKDGSMINVVQIPVRFA